MAKEKTAGDNRREDTAELGRRLWAALYLPVAIIAVLALILGVQLQRQVNDAQWVEHSDLVLAKTRGVESAILEQETALLKYSIGGDEAYVNEFRDVHPRELITELRILVDDNRAQVERTDAIRDRYNDWAENTANPMLRDVTFARSAGAQHAEKERLANVRAVLVAAEKVELDLRRERADAAGDSLKMTRTAFGALFLLAAGALAFVSRRQLSTISGVYEDVIAGEREAREATDRERWIREGQMKVAEAMLGEQTLERLGDSALVALCKYVGADVATFFAADASRWKRIASRGVDNAREAPAFLGWDEGLIGRAAADKAVVHLKDIPRDFLRIRSGVGERDAVEVVAVPGIVDDVPFAVIELGFLRPLDDRTLELFSRLKEPTGAAVRSETYRRRLRELLEESQQQTEELQTQQEELRVANEELEQQSVALREARNGLEERQHEVEETNARLEEKAHELTQSREAFRAKATEAERASRFKSEFLANMSHELRTPLNSTLILAKLLAENRDKNLTDEQVRYATMIHNSGNDLLALINDILDLAKVEAGHVEIQVAQTKVDRIIEALSRTFEPIARNKQVQFSITREPGVPDELVTDALRVEQVLKNLLSNALKFTHQGSVTLRIHNRDDRIVFDVTDTGIGIAPEEREIIFEPFRQADGTTNRKYGGTGLGLSISRELVHLLGGTLVVDSTRGKGSTFTFELPHKPMSRSVSIPKLSHAEVAPRASAPVHSENTRKTAAFRDDRATITKEDRVLLVIEDDVAFARVLYDFAKERQLKCVVADDAREGLELAHEYVPSAIVLDINLPDRTGLYVLDQLKHDPTTRHVPVHIVSVGDYADRAMSMGAVGYLKKPATPESLASAFGRLETTMSRRPRRLLIVEDDDIHRESLTQLLSANDLEIVTAATVREALEALKAQSVDCVVTDIGLPDDSGFELIERMANDESYAFPPVIVYTGRKLTPDEEARLRKYSSSIIVKGARSVERLLDEVSLFLHQVESQLPQPKRDMLQQARDRDTILEGKTILIVEDDVRNVFALTKVLEPLGARVLIARNGRDALGTLDKVGTVDLILMDIMMPEMDGLEAMRAIRSRNEWKKLPIIALTAKAMPDDRDSCLGAGASDYVPKPIDVGMLVSLVRVWMPR